MTSYHSNSHFILIFHNLQVNRTITLFMLQSHLPGMCAWMRSVGQCSAFLDDVSTQVVGWCFCKSLARLIFFFPFCRIALARASASCPSLCQHSGLPEKNEEATICDTALLSDSTQSPHYHQSNTDFQDIWLALALFSSPLTTGHSFDCNSVSDFSVHY